MRLLISIVAISLLCCKPAYQKKSITTDVVPMMDNSRTALDWPGTYHGTLPCADCEGIKTELIIKQDNNYTIRQQYLGKSDSVFVDEGVLSWGKMGNNISLEHNELKFQVGENTLLMLDKSGNIIPGDMEGKYNLMKVENNIIDRYWVLVEINGKPILNDKSRVKEPYFTLKEKDNRAIGHGGCNSFFGYYKLGPNKTLVFEKLATTRMACNDNNLEHQYISQLERSKTYELNGDILVVKGEKGKSSKFISIYFY